MEAIGAYYQNALDQVNGPDATGPNGTNGYYIPGPTGSMDCATMQTYKDQLENQISYWNEILRTGNNGSRERENLNKIIVVQTSKRNLYNEYMLRNCTVQPETTPVPEVLPTDQPTYDPGQIEDLPQDQTIPPVEEKKTNWLLIGGVGAALFLIARRKKGSRKKKVSGIGGGIMPLLILGGGAYILYKNSHNTADKKNYLLTVAAADNSSDGGAYFKEVINKMTEQEIADTYKFFKDYVNRGLQVPQNTDLWYAINAISNKYNIFT